MKKQLSIFILSIALILSAQPALAVVEPTPVIPGSTYQMWSFFNSETEPQADIDENPYGVPELLVDTSWNWMTSDQSGRTGIWPITREMDIYLPNSQEPNPIKFIWIELTWNPNIDYYSRFLPNQPSVSVASNPVYTDMQMSRYDEPLEDGWITSTFNITLLPNPFEEWIAIKGYFLIDQIEIGTLCIPEPATLGILAIGGLALIRRTQKKFNH